MIDVNDFKPGISFTDNAEIYVVVEAQHSKSGRGQAHVKAKVKNLRSGATTVITYTGGDKVAKALIEKTAMQYLYDDGANIIFMDTESYDQVEIPIIRLEWEKNFLKEGSMVQTTKYQNELLGIILPVNVELQIQQAEAAVKGDSATGASKKAVLETGFEIQVPLFIKDDELVIVSTADGKYVGRA